MSPPKPKASGGRDRHHLLRLQRALWHDRGSRVSLMVGAGVSLNARPLPGVRTGFPTWSQLADNMWNELYPPAKYTTDTKPSRPRNGLTPERIASEYVATFDRGALNDLIRRRVPDSGHEPGPLHDALLQLPWRDVFTTNYDRLLERTIVPGRSYHPVTSATELTRATPPRIIKLHGSFGADGPLIATEEDYRTYPRCFAPFVNTVRQTLIENSLVLVGFKGDDRNFLEWIGWIRDELGDHHCPIYLVVIFPMDDIERSLLIARGVTPIDLPALTGTCPSGTADHEALLLDFARRLWDGRRRADRWPIDETQNDPPSLPRGGDGDGAQNSTANANSEAGRDARLLGALQRWQEERQAYPGWVVAPAAERQKVWRATSRWVGTVLQDSAAWPAADRVVLVSEMNWRLEVAMAPLFPEWAEGVEDSVMALAERVRAEHGRGVATEKEEVAARSDWSVSEGWVRLVLALARTARETHNETAWTKHKAALDSVIQRFPVLIDLYHYETALWHLAQVDRAGARQVVAVWVPRHRSPRGMLWKAGVLAEIGQAKDARNLLREALREIRLATGAGGGRNVELLSMEGWCTYLLFFVEVSVDLLRLESVREEFDARWRELRELDCDPWRVHDYFVRELGREAPEQAPDVQEQPAFDPGQRRVNRRLGGGGIGPWLPAFACLRWFEDVGLPMRLRGVSTDEHLVRACEWVAPFFSFRSIWVLLRAGAAGALEKERFVTRPQVADMEVEVVERLSALMLVALERENTVVRAQAHPWTDTHVLEALVEVSSRLALRLDDDGLRKAFDVAMDLYREWLEDWAHGLAKAVGRWFVRLYEAADAEVLEEWLPDLLDSPLPRAGEEQSVEIWRDPLDGFRIGEFRATGLGSAETEERIRRVVERLLKRGRDEPGRRREDVVWRLVSMVRADLLNEVERRELGELVWSEHADGSFPKWKNLVLDDYAGFPAPDDVEVLSAIRRELLSRASAAGARRDGGTNSVVIGAGSDGILDVGPATRATVAVPYEPSGFVEWDAEEIRTLWVGLLGWWRATRLMMRISKARKLPFGHDDRIRASAVALEMFLVRVKVAGRSADEGEGWKELDDLMGQAREVGVELGGVWPYLLIDRPGERGRIEMDIVRDLAECGGRRAAAAARAVRHWVYLVAAARVEGSAATVVSALADRVAFRRLAGAQSCIRELAALLVDKGEFVSGESVDRLVVGLEGWEEAVESKTGESRACGMPPDERPDLREAVGVLVNALNTWWGDRRQERPVPPAVKRVLETYSRDPLPEVRRAVSEERWRYW